MKKIWVSMVLLSACLAFSSCKNDESSSGSSNSSGSSGGGSSAPVFTCKAVDWPSLNQQVQDYVRHDNETYGEPLTSSLYRLEAKHKDCPGFDVFAKGSLKYVSKFVSKMAEGDLYGTRVSIGLYPFVDKGEAAMIEKAAANMAEKNPEKFLETMKFRYGDNGRCPAEFLTAGGKAAVRMNALMKVSSSDLRHIKASCIESLRKAEHR